MPATLDQKLAFRRRTALVFMAIERAFEIPTKIPLIQSAHESNWGLSKLAADDNNLFGMTPGDKWLKAMRKEIPIADVPRWSSLGVPTTYLPTTEYVDLPPNKIHYWEFPGDIADKRDDGKGGSVVTVNRFFRKYATVDESAWDWARKLAHEPRYAETYTAAKSGDVSHYAAAILASGYATDKDYADGINQTGRAVAALPSELAG